MSLHPWLSLDPKETIAVLSVNLKEAVSRKLSRKGTVVAISGGIDSPLCAALAAAALRK